MTEIAAVPDHADREAIVRSQVREHPAKAIFLASVGNALEWFDLSVFGFLSVVISGRFFPGGNPAVSLLLTLATFGLSFLMRPLGGIVIGVYADRAGRMKAMVMSVLLMMVGTAIIAFIPTYETIGVAATAGLVIARLIQGFAAGGQFGSATAFLAEQSPDRRGFFASWQIASQGLTTLLASGFGAALSNYLSPADLQGWGWRIPFMFGLIIGPLALLMRHSVPETAEFRAIEPSKTPLRDVLRDNKTAIVAAVGATLLGNVATFVVLFMPSFAVRQLGLPVAGAFMATLVTGVVQLILSPVAGALSDRVGRIPVMAVSGGGMLVLIWPLFLWLTSSPTIGVMLVVQAIYGVLLTGYFATVPALLCEMFPVRIRTIGLSLSYNIAVSVFGGFAPAVVAWLIVVTGSKLAPSYYVMAAALLSLSALTFIRLRMKVR